MAYRSPLSTEVAYVTGVVGTVQAATLIFTPAARFTPVSVVFELMSVTGFAVVATASIGTNSAAYNNLLVASALTGLSAANNIINFNVTALTSSVASGTGVYVNVSVAATATTYVLKVSIVGFYN